LDNNKVLFVFASPRTILQTKYKINGTFQVLFAIYIDIDCLIIERIVMVHGQEEGLGWRVY
jgi:hypothetical protein